MNHGSPQFGKIDSTELMKEAANYISECNERVLLISKEISELNNKVEELKKHAAVEVERIIKERLLLRQIESYK